MTITVSHKPTETGSKVGVMAKGDSQTAHEAALSGVLLRVLCGSAGMPAVGRERG